MKKIIEATMLACALVSAPAWAINKCTGPDGKTVFQDAPCAGKGERLDVRPASGHASSETLSASAKSKAEIASIERRSEIQAAIARGEPLIGMTREQLDQAMGAPQRINPSNYNGVRHDQLIYERGGRTWYVYTESGVVRSIQNTASIGAAPSSSPSAKATPCPSPQEIRDAETHASSITHSEATRLELLRQLRDMKNCGR